MPHNRSSITFFIVKKNKTPMAGDEKKERNKIFLTSTRLKIAYETKKYTTLIHNTQPKFNININLNVKQNIKITYILNIKSGPPI
jgi:hypothetical protein